MASASEVFWSNTVRSRIDFLQCKLLTSKPLHMHEARRRIQEELDAMSVAFSYAAAAFNDLAPIFRLPNEILSAIFKHLSHIDAPGVDEYGCDLGWISVTHVCQSWRHVALDNASLWTTVSSEVGFQWIEEMLRRSKNCLVDVEISECPSDKDASDFVDILMRHVPRTRTLKFLAPFSLSTQIVTALTACAPSLEEIVVAADESFDVIALPPGLFAGGTPPLSKVFLRSCANFPWSVVSANLESIRLDNMAGDAGRMSSQMYISFMDALSQATRLNAMQLEDVLPLEKSPDGIVPPYASDGSHIPSLCHLTIIDIPTPLLAFMRHFQVGQSTHLILDCVRALDADDIRSLLPHLRSFAGATFNPFSAYVEVLVPGLFKGTPGAVRIRAWNTVVEFPPNVDGHFGPSPDLEVRFSWIIFGTNAVGRFCRDVCVALRMHGLRSLAVKEDGATQLFAQLWTDAFGTVRDVRRLILSMNAGDSFCRAFAAIVPPVSIPSPSTALEPQVPMVLFPSLESLAFSDTWFGGQFDSDTAGRPLHEALTIMLKARVAAGCMPKIITMDKCDTRPWIEEWVSVVGSEAAREWNVDKWTEADPE